MKVFSEHLMLSSRRFLKVIFPTQVQYCRKLAPPPPSHFHQRRLRWEEREGEVWQSESSRLTPPSALLRLQHRTCTTTASQCPNFSSIFSLTPGSFFFRVPPLNLWGPGERPCFWAKQRRFSTFYVFKRRRPLSGHSWGWGGESGPSGRKGQMLQNSSRRISKAWSFCFIIFPGSSTWNRKQQSLLFIHFWYK